VGTPLTSCLFIAKRIEVASCHANECWIADENEQSSITSHPHNYFLEFNKAVLERDILAKPWEAINCSLFAGFQRSLVKPVKEH
jgi:hypothetical protein